MALQTKGFVNDRQRNRKFSKHGTEFGASNAEEYERFADEFLGGSAPSGIQECARTGGDRLRYDPLTEAFGVVDSTGIIRSYYRPVPCASIRDPLVRATVRLAGMCHRYANNLLYFQEQCGRLYGG
jgi:hypothetical protein